MLQTQTVDTRTLALLKELMSLNLLKDYYLVGGTALALLYGHRISVDLDLFGKTEIDRYQLLENLRKLGSVKIFQDTVSILQILISDTKVDIVKYPYDLIKPIKIDDGVRLASPQDIAAMKVTAIGTRATKKDFFDLYVLLEHYQISEIINFCHIKFPDRDLFHYIKSLTYFDEVEKDDENPKMLIEVGWNQVKDRIRREVNKISSI